MVDTATAVGLIATPGMALLVGIMIVRISYYGKRTLELHEKTGPWLTEVQTQLENEVNRQGRTMEDITNMASKFSSVKSIQERFERLHKQNTGAITTGILTAIAIIVAIFANISASDGLLITLTNGIAAAFWFVNIVYFYQFHNELSALE